MSQPDTRVAEHNINILAPAKVVYQYIADVANWPQLFPPTIHVEHLDRGDSEERIQIWATANGEAKTWTSRRTLDESGLRIEFRQEVSQPPVASMSGIWIIEPTSENESLVRLLHVYQAVGDDPDKLAWIDEAVDRNSRSELAALKSSAELAAGDSNLLLTFDDTMHINGSANDVYDFINEAHRWSERLPHVVTVSMQEKTPGLQVLEMDTRAKDGSMRTTKSIRVTFPSTKIVYKQIQTPALLKLHTGHWLFGENSDGVVVTSRHTVVINEAGITKVLGKEATVEEARTFVRTALSANSLATLQYAKEHVELG